MTPRKVLIVSGEASGDAYAADLVSAVGRLRTDLAFFGLGLARSRAAGVDLVRDMSAFSFIGVTDVLTHLGPIRGLWKDVLARVDRERPAYAILIDYPGFNLRLARELKARGIEVLYYVSPQVWAWGRWRIRTIKECVRKVFVFFPFEEELYRKAGVDAVCVGHPLIDIVAPTRRIEETQEIYRLDPGRRTVALLPGSRRSEVAGLLPVMLGAARHIASEIPNSQFVVAKAPGLDRSLYAAADNARDIRVAIADGDTYNAVAASKLAIVASGTATLETALLGVPLVVAYTGSLVTYLAFKSLAETPWIGLVNIVAGRTVAPEFVKFDATAAKIGRECVSILNDRKRYSGILEDLKGVRRALGAGGATERAAKEISNSMVY